jgi:hypothetical protein
MIETIQHWRAQLVQPGVCKLHLRLNTRGARKAAARGLAGHILQQRRLTHAGIAVHHQNSAFPGPHGRKKLVQRTAFGAAVNQAHILVWKCPPLLGTDLMPHCSSTVNSG